ncbi:MAG: ABC transporter ATP-binding protein [Stellaceae bacterium]
MTEPLLEVEGLTTFYDQSQVLFGIDLAVGTGEVVTLMGRNGMGKTTTLRSIMGLKRAARGSVRFLAREMRGRAAFQIARAGIAIVPEGRQIFPNLTVAENLAVAFANRAGHAAPWTPRRIVELFPRLAERGGNMGSELSGGEQQMLAIGRALVTNPRLLLFDEATEGLAPLMRDDIWHCLETLKEAGQAILVVDKNVDALLRIADRHVIIEKGRVVWTGSSAALASQPDVQQRYLGV